jgi:hypothetical protein
MHQNFRNRLRIEQILSANIGLYRAICLDGDGPLTKWVSKEEAIQAIDKHRVDTFHSIELLGPPE